jgi:uncharacterized membrane protein YidH (DUF202 family)
MTAWERTLLQVSVFVSAATGLAFWVMKDLMRPLDDFSVVGHPWQPQALAIHVLAGPALVFALGLVTREHIVHQIRNGRSGAGGRSGLAAVALAAPMIVSGYILEVMTRPSPRAWMATLHLVTGALFAAAFAGHVVTAARARRAACRERRLADQSVCS